MRKYLIATLTFLMAGCDFVSSTRGSSSDRVVTSWAKAYFNYDFQKASDYVTAESEPWLRFAASNVSEADIALIRQQPEGATVRMLSYDTESPDTLNNATIEVSHFVYPDSIGRPSRVVENARFIIPIVKRNGKWFVRMEGLPRSEKQSHD